MTPRQIKNTFNYGTPLAAVALVGLLGSGWYVADKLESKQVQTKQIQVSREVTPFENAVCNAKLVKGVANNFLVSSWIADEDIKAKYTLSDSAGQEVYDNQNPSSSNELYTRLFQKLNPNKKTNVINNGETYYALDFNGNGVTGLILDNKKFDSNRRLNDLAEELTNPFVTPAGNCTYKEEKTNSRGQRYVQ